MAWSSPLTGVANSSLTSAQWNASVRDNLNETAPAKFTAAGQFLVSTGANAGAARTPSGNMYTGGGTDTTTSTSYIGLTGSPSFAVTTGTSAFVLHGASVTNDTAGARSAASYEISSATAVSASDTWALMHDISSTGRLVKASMVYLHTGLTAGSNVFTGRYRVSGGTGTFTLRSVYVLPL